MKKILALSAAAVVAATSYAQAGFDIGVGVSSVSFGGKTTNATVANSNRDVAKTTYAPDVMMGYTFMFGKYSVGLMASAQMGGGQAVYDAVATNYFAFKRKEAFGAMVNFGMNVAPMSTVYLQTGAKNAKFDLISANSATTKTTTKKTKTGWVLGIGFKQTLSESMALDMGYQYVSYGKVVSPANTYSDPMTVKMAESNVRLGVTYSF